MNVGLGTASFGTTIPEKIALELMDTFVRMGGSIIDTANNYAFWSGWGGESEQVIGKWLKQVDRGSVQIHTKIGGQPLDGKNLETAEGLGRKAIDHAIDLSLSRLGTDYVDVLYTHFDDRSTPLLETWETLTEYQQKGIVKRLGISNYVSNRVNELADIIQSHDLSQIGIAQYRYSAIPPKDGAHFGVQICLDDDLKQILRTRGVTIVAYSPLLDGAFENGRELPDNYQTEANLASVAEIRREAERLGVSPSALVLKRIAGEEILPLTMTGKMERLKGNLQLFV